jgi:small subunit ribosomal protein S16
MPVKIRLQRHGKKGKPFYWIVAADARAKRDGKFLEKLGIYNPNTNPATIEVDIDSSVKWLQNGAQPTDTAKAILSYRGVLLKHHLLGGVRKGALTEEQAEEKFNTWISEKEQAIADKVGGLDKVKADERAAALKAEKEVNDKRAAEAAAALVPDEPEVTEDVEAVVEETTETVTEEVEVVVEETTETVTEEVEVVVEETKEAVTEKVEAVEAAGEPEQVVKATDATPEAPAAEEDKA